MHKQEVTMHLDANAGGSAFKNDDKADEINADFSQAVFADTQQMQWQASPATGVMRKRLELIGKDTPRLTTVVKFEPGSHFDEHGHPGGEEFFVLSGTFSDTSGNFKAGSYVRNPSGWVHAPWTDEGCVLFVKLHQFQSSDKQRVIVDTNTDNWQPTGNACLLQMPLHKNEYEKVDIYQLTSGAEEVKMDFKDGAELLIVHGSFRDASKTYSQGSWLRLPAGSSQVLSSDQSCRFYCKKGNLSRK